MSYLESMVLLAWMRRLPDRVGKEFDAAIGQLKPEDAERMPRDLLELIHETLQARLRSGTRRGVLVVW